MAFDPYAELGLDRGATPADVKDAYRRKAKKAHPDAGGSQEKFERLTKGYLVLSNPDRRARYDSAGTVDESVDNLAAGAVQIMVQVILAAVEQHLAGQGRDPEGVDLVAAAKAMVRQPLDHLRESKANALRQADKVAAVAKRFKPRKGKPNTVVLALDQHASLLRGSAAGADRGIEAHEMALKLLDGYRFDFDPARNVTPQPRANVGGFVFMR